MTPRAFRKKQRRKFKVGDYVTWGNGSHAEQVLAVKDGGLLLTNTDQEWSKQPSVFVLFEGGITPGRCPRTGGRGQIRKAWKKDKGPS